MPPSLPLPRLGSHKSSVNLSMNVNLAAEATISRGRGPEVKGMGNHVHCGIRDPQFFDTPPNERWGSLSPPSILGGVVGASPNS